MNKLNAGKASVLALVATLVVTSFLFVNSLNTILAQAPPSIDICHATNSNENPYNSQSPNIQNDGSLTGGHLDHKGPIWNPTLKADKIQWGDIIPAYTNGDFSFPGYNNTAEGLAILNNNCEIPGSTNPEDPEDPEEPTKPQPTPFDACTNVAGIQTSIPDGWFQISDTSTECREFQMPGPPSSDGGEPQGQVLGASTMASAGSFTENLYLGIMAIGAALTLTSLKSVKKAYKKA